MTSTRSKWGLRLSVLYFAMSAAALVWPIYPWLGNHIEPRVLGLPFSLVWVLGVIACNFGVLALLYGLRLIDAEEPNANTEGQPQP